MLTEATEIIFYELPKMEQHVNDYFAGRARTESLSAEEKWCIFLRYRHEKKMKPLIDELCLKEEGIMHAEKEVVKVSRSFKKYVREMSEMKDEIDQWYKMEAVRKEGLEKGHVKGREDERKYILDLFAQGLPTEEIKRHLEHPV